MYIDIDIQRDQLPLDPALRGLATGAHTRAALAPRFERAAANVLVRSSHHCRVHETTLRRMVDRCSEQLVFRALEDVKDWFSYTSGSFFSHGYPRLHYAATGNRKPTSNKSAIAAVGEGVAGLLAMRLYRGRLLARPFHDYPDIVLGSPNGIMLVEAKATTEDKVNSIASAELPRLAAYAASVRDIDPAVTTALLVVTRLVREQAYEVRIVEISL